MDFRFLGFLSLKISAAFIFTSTFGQMEFKNIAQCYKGNYPAEDIGEYRNIFIIRFGFCNGSRYCGNDLYRYVSRITERSHGKTLIITSDTAQDIIKGLAGQGNTVIRYISGQSIEKYGGFSAYNLYINKRRKIKRLI